MDNAKVVALLERARANLLAAKNAEAAAAAASLATKVAGVDTVDVSKLGITDELLKTDAGQDQAVDIMSDVAENVAKDVWPIQLGNYGCSNYLQTDAQDEGETPEAERKVIGVARDVILNEKQQQLHDMVVIDGKDCVLIGAAGTGKTTSMRKITRSLIDCGRIKLLGTTTKWLQAQLPGAVILSYTRKATNNIRHAVAEELKPHTITIHKLIEFAPIYYEVEDPSNKGLFKTTMRFEPQRNRVNPLPQGLKFIGFEESSMIAVELFEQLCDAMQHTHQVLFLGDIQQLPPIFGLAILGFKMQELPVVELTEVYRQALESPIIALAWKLLEGNPHDFSSKKEKYKAFSQVLKKDVERIRVPALDTFSKTTASGKVFFQPWQKQLSPDHALITATKQFTTWADEGYYNPEDDIILLPFNKAFGTVELNKGIAQHLGTKREAVVHEVIAGFNKHYLAIGDRVLYDKEDAFIVDIVRNDEYVGKAVFPASRNLDRWGHLREDLTKEEQHKLEADADNMDAAAIEKFMELSIDEAEDRVNAASHVVTVRLAYGEDDIDLSAASDINNLLGGYAITVHKAQGSEWEKVFFVMHHTHAVMNQRELLYTAVTRARSFLHVICEPDTFEKGVKSQRIKGNTLAEKAEWFKGKQTDRQKKLELEQATKIQAAAGSVQVAQINGKVAIRLEDIVPPAIDKQVQANVKAYWDVATAKFGPEIGECPTVSYRLNSRRIVGQIWYHKNVLKLNPVWLAVPDTAVVDSILADTIIHELCHMIDWKKFKNKGHGGTWRLCMTRMGIPPSRLHVEPLPPYLATKMQLLDAVFKQFAGTEEQTTDEVEAETEEVAS